MLLLGYEMYRLLTTKRVLAKPRRAASRKTSSVNPPTTTAVSLATTSTAFSAMTSSVTSDTVCIDLDEEDSNKELLKGFIVVGCRHFRSSSSCLSLVVQKVKKDEQYRAP